MSDLAKALRVRREFFLRPVFDSPRPMFYRKLVSTLKRDREYQKTQVNWLHEISDVLQHYVDYTPASVGVDDVLLIPRGWSIKKD